VLHICSLEEYLAKKGTTLEPTGSGRRM